MIEVEVILVLLDNLHHIAQNSKASERVENSPTLFSNNIKQKQQDKYAIFTVEQNREFQQDHEINLLEQQDYGYIQDRYDFTQKHRIIVTNACLIKSSTLFSVLYHFASIVTHLNVSTIVHYLKHSWDTVGLRLYSSVSVMIFVKWMVHCI